jgi:arginine decarboxylase-like protein
MKNVGKVVHVACILHNWCINERLRQANEADAESDEDLVTALAELRATNSVEHATPPQAAQDVTVSAQDASAFRRLYDSTQLDVERRVESELLRNAIVAQIGSTLRPQHNICRNAPARA